MQASQFEVSIRRATARGFTMVELMAVVAIVGILAMIATAGYRRYIAHSKTAEVPGMFAAIKYAEESYKEETFKYLGPSGEGSAGDLTIMYPVNSAPGRQKVNFAGDTNGGKDWQKLGVQTAGPVLFVYACTAGGKADTPTALGAGLSVGNYPPAVYGPWYVVKARGDLYGNGVDTVFATASFTNDLFSGND